MCWCNIFNVLFSLCIWLCLWVLVFIWCMCSLVIWVLVIFFFFGFCFFGILGLFLFVFGFFLFWVLECLELFEDFMLYWLKLFLLMFEKFLMFVFLKLFFVRLRFKFVFIVGFCSFIGIIFLKKKKLFIYNFLGFLNLKCKLINFVICNYCKNIINFCMNFILNFIWIFG